MSDIMRLGFLPLVDAALPILARELGLGEEEGLALDLVRDMSWATVRDRLVYGRTDAARLCSPRLPSPPRSASNAPPRRCRSRSYSASTAMP